MKDHIIAGKAIKQLQNELIELKGLVREFIDVPILLAQVAWQAADIQTLCPEWSDEKCNEWLDANEESIQDAMIAAGWEIIESLLPVEE